jgi:hypothetical protein
VEEGPEFVKNLAESYLKEEECIIVVIVESIGIAVVHVNTKIQTTRITSLPSP